MKNSLLLFGIAALMLFAACEGSSKIFFEDPQPANKRDRTEFRKSFLGTYAQYEPDEPYFLSVTRLHVESDKVVREMNWFFNGRREELAQDGEFDFDVYNDSLWHEEVKEIEPPGDLRLTEDSVIFTWQNRDTLFQFSGDTRLRYFRKHHFLNYQAENDSWRLTLLARKADTLWVRKLTVPEDSAAMYQLLPLREVQNEEGQIQQYILDPSRKQLRKFLKMEGVVEEEGFVKE